MAAPRCALCAVVADLWGGQFSVSARQPNPPRWPDSVHIFTEDTDVSAAQAVIDAAWEANGKQGDGMPAGQFSSRRYAFLFEPGSYSLDVPVGYYTQVLGLGEQPDEVEFHGLHGPYVPCNFTDPHGPGQLNTFWRSAENFKRRGSTTWAVSQAAPVRRVHVTGDLILQEKNCWASGGYLANAHVHGTVFGGGQQQWFTRSSSIGKWDGVGWNRVFVGVDGLAGNSCGVSPHGPRQTVAVETAPVVAEKPFISVDRRSSSGSGSRASKFNLNVPPVRRDSSGIDWTTGAVYPFESVYVTQPSDAAADINAALAAGLHVVVSPGVYALGEPLLVSNPGQVLLCIGLATLRSASGNAVIKVASRATGVRIGGCLLEAGDQQAETLLHWGDSSDADAGAGEFDADANAKGDELEPGFLHDLFARVGGPTNKGAATTMVRIDSGHVVGDNLWLWRADHYDSGNHTPPISDSPTMLGELPCDHGLVVTGDDVTMYGLAVEHTLKDQVVWSGERGSVYFFQCEIPYDVAPDWGKAGYAAYKVDDDVKEHSAHGIGVYSFFRDHEVWMPTAIKTPVAVQASVAQPFVVFLSGHGGINSTINGEGPGARGPTFDMHFVNNECGPPSSGVPWKDIIIILCVGLPCVLLAGFLLSMCMGARAMPLREDRAEPGQSRRLVGGGGPGAD